MNLANYIGHEPRILTAGFFDDFEQYNAGTAERWQDLQADAGGSVAHDADGLNGRLTITAGTTDNHEAYVGTQEILQILDGKPGCVMTRLQYAEANTDAANIIFGVCQAPIAADNLINDSGGPKASLFGAVIYKVDGETRWRFQTEDGGSDEQITELDYTAGGAGFITLAITWNPISATEVIYTPWIDTAGGNNLQQMRQYNVSSRTPLVQHRTTYANNEGIGLTVGAKAGSTSVETLTVDFASVAVKR